MPMSLLLIAAYHYGNSNRAGLSKVIYLAAKARNLPVSSTPVEHIFTQNGIIYSKS